MEGRVLRPREEREESWVVRLRGFLGPGRRE